MTRLLVCIDGSSYADNICMSAAWVAKQLKAEIDLLHVLRRQSDYKTASDDLTGSIGLGVRNDLLEELTKIDEQRGRLDQEKGKVILSHGEKVLKKSGIKKINVIHRRGSLVETIKELEESVDMIFMGKRGEHADLSSVFLGSNLEKVARAIHSPLFVVSSVFRPIKKFLIAYDGKASAQKAVDYLVENPWLKKTDCYLLAVEPQKGQIDISSTAENLRTAGYKVQAYTQTSEHADSVITSYVEDNDIDLLLTGAYSHSRIRSLLLGSTTAALCKSCKVSMLLFR